MAEAVRGRRELAAEDTTGELATALQSLGGVYDSQDRFDEAEAAYREAEQIFIRDVGSDNPRLAFLLLDIAILNNRRERPEGNVELLQRAIAISDQSLGPGHPFAGAAQGILARVHYRAGRYPPALEAQQAGLEIFEATVPATQHSPRSKRTCTIGCSAGTRSVRTRSPGPCSRATRRPTASSPRPTR